MLQTGEIDVLIRNTTYTLQRDTELGADFVGVNFYDGQGMTVPKASKYKKLEDLKDKTICVQKGTTTELNLADQMGLRKTAYKPLTFETADEVWGAYEAERCDAITTDKSGLISRMSLLKKPADHEIMDVTMSKEPLGPMVRHGDNQWADVVRWTMLATIAAEEYGVNSKNADQLLAESKDPETQRLLGKNGDMGKKLGIDNAWAFNVIKKVGNYAEIYDRNLGPNTPTFIPRGLNSLYTQGGILYSPPVR
jgi:general L-amino acid transport system substrate-binding protein